MPHMPKPVNFENEGVTGKNLGNNPALTGQEDPWNQKYFDLFQKPKIPKFQLPLTLAGGAHYGYCLLPKGCGLLLLITW